MDPRGFPTTLPEFQRVFPDDGACATYLERLRWPDGFACDRCGVIGEPYRFAARPGVLRCQRAHPTTEVTMAENRIGMAKTIEKWMGERMNRCKACGAEYRKGRTAMVFGDAELRR